MSRTPDVVVVGAGPVGLTMALLLARHGLRVDILEKHRESIEGPRAVAVDDESLRIWQSCGVDGLLQSDCQGGEPGQPICTYIDAKGRGFLSIYQRESDLGHLHAMVIHQGRIEAKLLAAANRHPSIRVHMGHEVDLVRQSEEAVEVEAGGGEYRSWARWVVGCDGAGSAVRRLIEVPMVGSPWPRQWLVANLEDSGDPGHVLIRCRKQCAAVTLPLPHGVRRVEVELDEHDEAAWSSDEREVRCRLQRGWEGASTARILKAAVCRFRSATAARWRDRRVFLAGDAAHLMPPFAGQGLGAGLRDAANLSFKIAGVSQGWLAASVLESYEVERRPHVEKMSRLAVRLGRLMSPRSSLEASVVQSALRIVGKSRILGSRWTLRGPDLRPRVKNGFVVPSRRAGGYLPQPTVEAAGGRFVRLDELLSHRMTWIVLRGGSPEALRPPLLQPSDTVLMEDRDFQDASGTLRRRYGEGSLLLVRPDRVVYCCVPAHGRRSSRIRRSACESHCIAVRKVRAVEACSSLPPRPRLAVASRTAPTPA